MAAHSWFVSPTYPPNPLSIPAGTERGSFIWWFDKSFDLQARSFVEEVSLYAYPSFQLSTQLRAVRRELALFERSEFRQLSTGGAVLGA